MKLGEIFVALQKADEKNEEYFDYSCQLPVNDTFELLTFIATDENGRYVESQQLLIQVTEGKVHMKWLT